MRAIMVKTVGDPALVGALKESAIKVEQDREYRKQREEIAREWKRVGEEMGRQEASAKHKSMEDEILCLRYDLTQAEEIIKHQRRIINDMRMERLEMYQKGSRKPNLLEMFMAMLAWRE